MGIYRGPNINTDNLLFYIDVGDSNCFFSGSTVVKNLAGKHPVLQLTSSGTSSPFFKPTFSNSNNVGFFSTNIGNVTPFSHSCLTFVSPSTQLLRFLQFDHTLEVVINPKSFTVLNDITPSTNELSAVIISATYTLFTGGFPCGLSIRSGSVIYSITSNVGAAVNSVAISGSISSNTRSHIIAVRSNNVGYLYINGVLQLTSSVYTVSDIYPWGASNIGAGRSTITSNNNTCPSIIDIYQVKGYTAAFSSNDAYNAYDLIKTRFSLP